MRKLTLTEAFAHYGAKLRNVQWAVSDIADGHLVVSLWAHKFRKAVDGIVPYEDQLSRWNGAGNKLFRQHLEQAFRDQLPVRVVIVRAQDPEAVDRGIDASALKKSFSVRPELTGQIVEYDGDQFVIEFRRDRRPGDSRCGDGQVQRKSRPLKTGDCGGAGE